MRYGLRVLAALLLSLFGFALLGPLLGGLLSLPLFGITSVLALPGWLHYAYFFGLLPAALAGLFNLVLIWPKRRQATLSSRSGLWGGALSACVFIAPGVGDTDFGQKALTVLLVCAAAGWLCAWVFNRWLLRLIGKH